MKGTLVFGFVQVDAWNSGLQHGFRLGDWLVRPDQCLIEGREGSQHLEPKLMEVLLYLALKQGEVVRREQLIEDVWRTVVNDEVLSRAVSLLRSHLGDDPKAPRYILTIPKFGYRLIAQPVMLEAAGVASPVEGAAATVIPPAPFVAALPAPVAWWRRRRVLAAAALLGSLLLLGWLQLREPSPSERVPGGYADLRQWFDALVSDDGAQAPITALAVLPFQDLSEAGNADYLGDSLTDELILALSRISGLKVVARRSVVGLPSEMRDIRTIGHWFGVDAILEGTVKLHGNRLRISVQLSGTRDGFVLWSDTYDEPLDDLFRLQDSVTANITRQLQAISTGTLRPPDPRVAEPSLEAYQLFLNGRYLVKLRGSAPMHQSIALFEKALGIDPSFSRARVALAQVTALLPFYDAGVDEEEMYQHALGMLDQLALEDPVEQAEAESIRGLVADSRWQWAEAEQHHIRSLELNPGDGNAYNWYSQHLADVGRLNDAVRTAARARELDSVSAAVVHRLAVTKLWTGDDVAAAENFIAGAQSGYASEAGFGYLVFLHRMHRWDEMQRLFTLIVAHGGSDATWVEALFREFRTGSYHAEAVEACELAIAEGRFPPRAELATWVLLGESDRAFARLAREPRERRYLDIEFLWAPESAALRADPRFRTVVEQLGLTAYWSRFGPPDNPP